MIPNERLRVTCTLSGRRLPVYQPERESGKPDGLYPETVICPGCFEVVPVTLELKDYEALATLPEHTCLELVKD